MIYVAKDLLGKLTHLSLWGQNEDGDLEWAGTREQWHLADCYSGDKVTIIEKSDDLR